MIFPTIHLNGTSRKQLQDQYIRTYEVLTDAINVLQQNYPNGRDYYPQGNGSIATAMDEHHDRILRVNTVRNEIEAILMSLETK